ASGLNAGDTFTVVSATTLNAAGLDGATINQGRYTFNLSVISTNLSSLFSSLQSFSQATTNALTGTSWHNVNLVSGAAHLDWLAGQPVDPALWTKIGNNFDENLALGGAQAAAGLQQMYGSYSAYANTALSSDAARFRSRWQGRNRSFLNNSIFSNLLSDAAGAGFASDSGLASPAYGAHDAIARGQSRIWAGGFGAWAKQDRRSNLSGYKYDSQGAVLGYEYTLGNLALGVAAAYSAGDLKVNDLRYKNDADVLNLAIYGAYIHESGFYAEGGLGYGHAWNDYKVNSIALPGGVKKGKYGSDSFTADLELGYIARLPRDFNLIPSVGVEYTHLRNSSWTEGVSNPALIRNRFDSSHDNGADIPLGLRFNKMFRFGRDGGFIVPEVRAAFVRVADKSNPSITSGFANAPGGFRQYGADPGRNHWRVGAGLSGRVNSRVDFRVDYDFEARSGFKGHNLNASVGLSF
ncbi:MAG: autotransporter outer membrane beta-barrel domain-containing protein, partial [Planctomycetota bacterium]|nr:autotransporter outer membrane beta-barrel domain-containing protein [Planctomycetota bacterium]